MADWFYMAADGELGPVDAAGLKRLAAEGTVDPATYVWREGLAEWVRAATVAGLFVADAPAPLEGASLSEPDVVPAPVVSYQPQPARSRQRRNVSRSGRSGFGDFIEFRTMITVRIVVYVFVLGSLAILGFTAYSASNIRWGRLELLQALASGAGLLVGALLSVLGWRLVCEFIVVVFRINESLTEFKNQERARGSAGSGR